MEDPDGMTRPSSLNARPLRKALRRMMVAEAAAQEARGQVWAALAKATELKDEEVEQVLELLGKFRAASR